MKRNQRLSLCVWACGLMLFAGAFIAPGLATAKKVDTRGNLFVAHTKFPTSAESIKKLRWKAWKHRKKKLRWRKGSDLSMWFMLIMKKKRGKLRTGTLYLVLFRAGVKDPSKNLGAHQLQVTKRTKLYTSPLTFSGSGLKKGPLYELRAVRIKGKRERIVARTYFRLK